MVWLGVLLEGVQKREKGYKKSTVKQSTSSILNPYARAVKNLFETSPVAHILQ